MATSPPSVVRPSDGPACGRAAGPLACGRAVCEAAPRKPRRDGFLADKIVPQPGKRIIYTNFIFMYGSYNDALAINSIKDEGSFDKKDWGYKLALSLFRQQS